MSHEELKQQVYELMERMLECHHSVPFSAERAAQFAREMGYALPADLLEWLQTCNGGEVKAGGRYLYGLHDPETAGRSDILDVTKSLYEEWVGPDNAPSMVELRWAIVGGDGCGDYYALRCEPDEFGHTPVYFWDEDMSYYMMASDWWHFLYGLLASEEFYGLHMDEPELPDFWWPFDREQTLAFDPALRVYEGRGLLPWE